MFRNQKLPWTWTFFSVMGKLPATSYVRLVDIWLIFGQLMPFIQVFISLYIVLSKIRDCLFLKLCNDGSPWDRSFWTCFHFSCLKVSLTTIAEIYNEDDHTINHHGFERNVKDTGRADELKVCGQCTFC